MSRGAWSEAVRQALFAAAQERLRTHLDRAAAALDDDDERVLAEVRRLTEQLHITARWPAGHERKERGCPAK